MFGIQTIFFYLNIFAYLVVELEEKLVELEGLWGKRKSHVVAAKNMRGNRRTGSETKTGKQHLTTETLLNEDSDSGSEQRRRCKNQQAQMLLVNMRLCTHGHTRTSVFQRSCE